MTNIQNITKRIETIESKSDSDLVINVTISASKEGDEGSAVTVTIVEDDK